MKKAGKTYPYAQHVNTVCNDKIKNLPADFKGMFIVEEVIMKMKESVMRHRIFS